MVVLWRKFRRTFLPDGSSGERLYYRLRLALIIIRENGFITFIKNAFNLMQIYMIQGKIGEASRGNVIAYQQRIKHLEPGPFQLRLQRRGEKKYKNRPLISIITPVYNPPVDVLEDTLNSVINQTYTNWEYCLANASDHKKITAVLDRFAFREKRIKVRHLQHNGGISANTNAAMEIAHGEFVVLLDHDDLLSPNALWMIVAAINSNPDGDIFYYDEDKITADGKVREEPFYKPPEFSPALLLSTNYLMHSAVRRSLVDNILPLNSQVDGAQDWEMALKLCAAGAKTIHIPLVLYHWRRVKGSVASDANAKPWAYQAQVRCLEDHLKLNCHPEATVSIPTPGTVRIHWQPKPVKVSIIIPSKDNLEKLKPCLEAVLHDTDYPDYEVLLVDNNSSDPDTFAYYDSLKAEPGLRILTYPFAYNFHIINNRATQFAQGEILLFLNNDTVPLVNDWLREMVGWLEQPGVAIVGARLVRPNGTTQHGGIIMGLCGHGSHAFDGSRDPLYTPWGSSEWYRDVMAVTGACLAIKKEVFVSLGGFDEIYKIAYGDIDLCLRAKKAGFRVIYTPFARVLHHEGSSRGLNFPMADVFRASAKMIKQVKAGDPYFSHNLSYWSRIPTVALPNEPSSELQILNILQDFDLLSPTASSRYTLRDWGLMDAVDDWPTLGGPIRRILLVGHELSQSGAPMIFLELGKAFCQAGLEVKALAFGDGPLSEDYFRAGIPLRVVHGYTNDPRLILPYLNQCDAVLINTILNWRVALAARALGKRVIWMIQESTFGQKLAQKNPGTRQAFDAADWVLFPSKTTAEFYTPYFNRRNYQTLYFGTSLPPLTQQNCKEITSDDDAILRLVNIATIEHRKGQDLLLEGYVLLPENLKNQIHLFLVGRMLDQSEPEFCDEVKRKVNRFPNVHYLGEKNRPGALSCLAAADGLILTSRDEAMPFSILEAMALSKLVVTTAVGGIAELIEDKTNGIIIPDLSARAIADCLSELADHPEWIRPLQQKARQDYLEKLTFEQFASTVLTLLTTTTKEMEAVSVWIN